MKLFTLRELLKKPSDVLGAAISQPIIITSRTFGNFKLQKVSAELEITKTVKEVK